MIKQEYINSLSIEQLRSLVDTFSEMLLDADEVNYIDENEEVEYEDEEEYSPRASGFYCEHTGQPFLDNAEG